MRMLHQAAHFKMPEPCVHPRVDHVLSHAIELIIRGNRLDPLAFILGAVVAESRDAKKLARDGSASAREEKTHRSKQKRASA